MALFVGTPDNDTITPATISAGVLIIPANSDLTGDDAIVSLGGDDVVEGDSGNDIASLGDGNDRFIWNPGDGDDIVDGGVAPTRSSSTARRCRVHDRHDARQWRLPLLP